MSEQPYDPLCRADKFACPLAVVSLVIDFGEGFGVGHGVQEGGATIGAAMKMPVFEAPIAIELVGKCVKGLAQWAGGVRHL